MHRAARAGVYCLTAAMVFAIPSVGIRVARAATPVVIAPAADAAGAPAPTVAPGKPLFDRWCAECHAPGVGHPGTQQLALIRGPALAVLEQRKDLTAAFIRYVVRNGQAAMPAYRPTEITDPELTQLAGYLAPPTQR